MALRVRLYLSFPKIILVTCLKFKMAILPRFKMAAKNTLLCTKRVKSELRTLSKSLNVPINWWKIDLGLQQIHLFPNKVGNMSHVQNGGPTDI